MANFCLSISLIFLINFKLSISLECIMCKESQYPNQCGATFNPLPATIPKIECDETCVTFKNAYDNGCKYFVYGIHLMDSKLFLKKTNN